jgi:hypothetical protein
MKYIKFEDFQAQALELARDIDDFRQWEESVIFAKKMREHDSKYPLPVAGGMAVPSWTDLQQMMNWVGSALGFGTPGVVPDNPLNAGIKILGTLGFAKTGLGLPTATVTGASGANVVLQANSSIGIGNVTFGTTAAPAAGAQYTLTYNVTFPAIPYVFMAAGNAATSPLSPSVTASTTTVSTQGLAIVPAASQGAGTYSNNYLVLFLSQ